MQIKVIGFGQIREITGWDEKEYTDILETDSLLMNLKGSFPSLAELSFRIAVNHTLVSENTPLLDNDEVALLPPFSGG